MTDAAVGRKPPPARYGHPPMLAPGRRRPARALTGLTIALGLAVAVVGYQRFDGAAVEVHDGVYELLDDHTVSVTISVTRKDPATPVVCVVRAKALDGAETGRREVLVGPSADRTVQITTTVKAYSRSSSGDAYGCGTSVPPYLTAP